VPAAIYTPVLIAGGGVVGLCALFLVWHGVPSLLGVPDEPMQDDGSAASPSAFGPIDQDRLEVLLRAEAHKRGADLWFSTELTWFEQDGAGVTAVLDDRAVRQRQTVRADYLIAGDGNHSPIRQRSASASTGQVSCSPPSPRSWRPTSTLPCGAAWSPSPTSSSRSRSRS